MEITVQCDFGHCFWLLSPESGSLTRATIWWNTELYPISFKNTQYALIGFYCHQEFWLTYHVKVTFVLTCPKPTGEKALFLTFPKKHKSTFHFQPMDLSCEVLENKIFINFPNLEYEECLINFKFISKEHSRGGVMSQKKYVYAKSNYHWGNRNYANMPKTAFCVFPTGAFHLRIYNQGVPCFLRVILRWKLF